MYELEKKENGVGSETKANALDSTQLILCSGFEPVHDAVKKKRLGAVPSSHFK